MGGVYGVLHAILRATAGSRGHERLPSPQATSSRRARARILAWSLDGLQSLRAWCGLAQQSDCVDRAPSSSGQSGTPPWLLGGV